MSNKKISILFGSIFYFLFIMLKEFLGLHNVPFYICSCAVFVLTTSGVFLLLEKKGGALFHTKTAELILACVSILIFFSWSISLFMKEPVILSNEKPGLLRQCMPFFKWFLIAAGITVVLLLLFSYLPKFRMAKGTSTSIDTAGTKRFSIKKLIRAAISLAFTIATSSLFYCPNLFYDTQGGTYHSTAYTNSIIMVCWRTPYSWRMHDYYGHYALIYMPFLKLLRRIFGINFWTGICIMIAIFSSISILAFLYVLDYFVKNDFIYFLSMFSIGVEFYMLMRGTGEYYQIMPQRLLFPILVVAFAVWEHKHEKTNTCLSNILAVVLLTLSIIWSTEIGLVAMLSFTAYRWVEHIYDGTSFHIKKTVSLFKYLLFFLAIPFAIAYLMVGCYNAWAGGDLFMSFEEYMYPLISEKGYISHIELPLQGASGLWVGISLLFLAMMCLSVLPSLFSKEEPKKDYVLYFLMGVLSEGSLIYYVNRPVYTVTAVDMYFAIIFTAVIFEKTQRYFVSEILHKSDESSLSGKAIFYLSYRIVSLFILVTMFLDGIYYIPETFKNAKETIWNMAEYDEFTQYVYVQVPPQAYYIGEGVPELAAYLDRDPSLHCTEWSINNMPPKELCAVAQDIEESLPQWLFWNLASLSEMQTYAGPVVDDNYKLHEVMEFNGVEFGMFDRIEQ